MTRARAEVQTLFQLSANWSSFKDLQNNISQCAQLCRQQNKLSNSDFSTKDATERIPDSTTVVSTNTRTGGLQLVRTKLTNRDIIPIVLAMCELGSSIWFLEKFLVSRLQLQTTEESLAEAKIHGPQGETQMMLLVVSVRDSS